MTRSTRNTALAASALATSFLCATSFAGDLTPPPGPVSATMQTLHDVRPSTPISDLPAGPDALHVITQPGVYHMTEDIMPGAGQHGVKIELDGLPPGEYYVCTIVTNGHNILAGAGSLDGVHYTDGAGHRETIEYCVGYSETLLSSISDTGGDGIHIEGADQVSISGVHITGCGGDGIDATNNQPIKYLVVKMKDCIVTGITGRGTVVTGFARCEATGCTIAGAGGNGMEIAPAGFVGPSGVPTGSVHLERCNIGSSGLDGVSIVPQTAGTYTFDLRVVDANGNAGRGVVVDTSLASCQVNTNFEDVRANSNGSHGIHERIVGNGGSIDSSDGTWRRMTASGNGGDGIFSDLQECTVSKSMDRASCNLNSGNGYNSQLQECTVSKSMDHCNANGNGGDGMRVQKDGPAPYLVVTMKDVIISSNGGSGVHVLPTGASGASDYATVSMDRCSATGNMVDGVTLAWTQTSGPFKFSTREGNLSSNIGNGLSMQACDGDGKDNNCNRNGGSGALIVDATLRADGGSYSNNGSHGVESDNSSCWIRVSQANGNAGDGFNVLLPGGVVGKPFILDGSSSNQNTGNGIVVIDSDATLTNFEASGNGMSGVTFDGTDPGKRIPYFSWGRCSSNGLHGILVGNSAGGTIEHCSASGNLEYGIWTLADTDSASIVDNNCNGNTGAIRVDGQFNVVCRNNGSAGVLGGITVAANNAVGVTADLTTADTYTNPAGNVVP